MLRKSIVLLGLITGCALWGFPGSVQAVVNIIATKSQESPPIMGEPAEYKQIEFPEVSNAGETTFQAVVKKTTPPKGRHKCIFKLNDHDTGGGEVIACKDDASPDSQGSGSQFQDFTDPRINADGDIVWISSLTGDGQGLYKASGGTIHDVILVGDAIPGGGVLAEILLADINDAGDVIFLARLTGVSSDTNRRIFRCANGDDCRGMLHLEELLLRGDAVPDQPGHVFCAFSSTNLTPALTASNFGIVFRAFIGASDCLSTDPGIFRVAFEPFEIKTIALQGEASEPSPEAGGTTYNSFRVPVIENGGIVVFVADTLGVLAKEFVYYCDPADDCPSVNLPKDVLETGGQADDGTTLKKFSTPSLSDVGDFAFQVELGVFVWRTDGSIETIAKKGSMVDGAIFKRFDRVSMSSDGSAIAFRGTIKGDEKPKKREGIFLDQ